MKPDHGMTSMKPHLFNFTHGANKLIHMLQLMKAHGHQQKLTGGLQDQPGTNIHHQLLPGLTTMNQQLNPFIPGVNALKHMFKNGHHKLLEEDHGTGHPLGQTHQQHGHILQKLNSLEHKK